MKEIIVVSDSHGNNEILQEIVKKHPKAYLYLHLGDSEAYKDEIFPFISVKGNNDYFDYEMTKIIEVDNHKIMMQHGHKIFLSKDNIVAHANKNKCDIFLYGHTHYPFYEFYRNVHIINPGSLAYPRSVYAETYAIIKITDKIDVEFKQIY